MSAAHPSSGGAVLYTVHGPRGSYFAIHDPSEGRVWTDRTAHAARTRANEMGLLLVAEEGVTHEELMRRTGRNADTPAKDANPDAPQPHAQFLFDDTGESFVTRRIGQGAAFLPAHPLEPHYSDLSDDCARQCQFTHLTPPEEDWCAPER